MKKYILLSLLVSVMIIPSCLKDKYTKSPIAFEPVFRDKSAVLADIKSDGPRSIGNPGKLYKYGNYIFLNEINKGVHIIDNTDPTNPVIKAFINIPGNLDIAVKGNVLYADLYTDMLAVDISNPLNAHLVKLVPHIFPERFYSAGTVYDTTKVIVDWIQKKVTERIESADLPITGGWWGCPNCMFMMDAATGPAAGGPTGVAGSMARFSVVNNYLYAVNTSSLNIVDISQPANPSKVSAYSAGWNIETIFPFNQKLFLGSSVGMFVFDISNPVQPVRMGTFTHMRACDPVVTDGNFAYVTLRAGNFCDGTTNELDVINVQNLPSTQLVSTYAMSNPYGLAKDGNVLFICDGKSGLKVYDASNVQDIRKISEVKGIETYDVIAENKKLILVSKDGLYQYDYTDAYNLHQLSRLTVNH